MTRDPLSQDFSSTNDALQDLKLDDSTDSPDIFVKPQGYKSSNKKNKYRAFRNQDLPEIDASSSFSTAPITLPRSLRENKSRTLLVAIILLVLSAICIISGFALSFFPDDFTRLHFLSFFFPVTRALLLLHSSITLVFWSLQLD